MSKEFWGHYTVDIKKPFKDKTDEDVILAIKEIATTLKVQKKCKIIFKYKQFCKYSGVTCKEYIIDADEKCENAYAYAYDDVSVNLKNI